MKSSTAKFFGFIALALALLVVIYVAAYLFTVKRVAGDAYGKDPSSPTYHYYVVGADLGRGVARSLFMPALKIDRGYIRRRYWEGSYIIETPTGTNVIYESDMGKYLAEHQK